ncbi:hypothetical protein [Micromonospora sp. URMC 103]|uniref:hypothetical protein n=1 Tax=Micromonospora sp. URMC 103 TaxID=3423406 RepID=UPI003F1E0C75
MVDLSAVVASGDRRAALEAIRDRLAGELTVAEGREVASVAKELRETIRELDSLPLPEGVSGVDQLAKKRAARRRKAAGE